MHSKFSMWQTKWIYFSLILILNECDKRQRFKIWQETFPWILETPYLRKTPTSKPTSKRVQSLWILRLHLTHWSLSMPLNSYEKVINLSWLISLVHVKCLIIHLHINQKVTLHNKLKKEKKYYKAVTYKHCIFPVRVHIISIFLQYP